MTDNPSLTSLSLALIGAGRMGGAMLRGWVEAGLDPGRTAVLDPHLHPDIEALVPGAARTIAAAPDVAVIAVKPQAMGEVLPPLADALPDETLIVSVAAGQTAQAIEDLLGGRPRPVVRAMPNTPALVRRGVTGFWANARVSRAQADLAETLLGSVGQVVRVEAEADIDAVTAVSGSGPAYVFHLVEALAEAGVAAGLSPATAQTLARATVSGAGTLLDASEDSAARLRENVTSPGGTTAAALDVLRGDGALVALMVRAVAAAKARSQELG